MVCVEPFLPTPGAPIWPAVISEGIAMSKRAEELEHPLLAKLLCSPIQRAPLAFWMGQRNGHSDHPFSFERAIKAARDGWAQGKAGMGSEEWMKGVLGYADEEATEAELERRIRQFSQLRIPAYYVCPRCESVL